MQLTNDNTAKKRTALFFGVAICVILFGIFLRLSHLGEQSYWMDEGYTVNAVISQMKNGTKHLASVLDSGQTYFCPLYCTPTALIVRVFGESPFNFRIFSAIFGILFVGLVFLISKKLFKDPRITLLATIFVSFSYWQIAWSRQARWYTLFEVFFWLSLLFTYLATEQKEKKRTLLCLGGAILSGAVAAIAHKLGYVLFPIIGLWFFLILIKRAHFKAAVGILFISSLTFLGIEAFRDFGFIKAILQIRFHYSLPSYLRFYLQNYWALILLSLYGSFSAKKEDRKKYILLLLPFTIYFLALSFLTNIIQYRYLLAPAACFFIAAAGGLITICRDIKSRSKTLTFGICLIGVILFFLSGEGVLKPRSFYALESDPETAKTDWWAYTPQPNFNAAYGFIKENLKENDVVISSHPHFNKIFLNQPGYWISYNYSGFQSEAETIIDGREYYVGAKVLTDLDALKQLTAQKHGFIIFDHMSIDGRIPPEIVGYILDSFPEVFYEETNAYSQIWVYQF